MAARQTQLQHLDDKIAEKSRSQKNLDKVKAFEKAHKHISVPVNDSTTILRRIKDESKH